MPMPMPIFGRWDGIVPADQCVSDYFRTKWPAGLDGKCHDDSVARHLDDLNDTRAASQLSALTLPASALEEAHASPLLGLVHALRQRTRLT
jgi:hypothetical protein